MTHWCRIFRRHILLHWKLMIVLLKKRMINEKDLQQVALVQSLGHETHDSLYSTWHLQLHIELSKSLIQLNNKKKKEELRSQMSYPLPVYPKGQFEHKNDPGVLVHIT